MHYKAGKPDHERNQLIGVPCVPFDQCPACLKLVQEARQNVEDQDQDNEPSSDFIVQNKKTGRPIDRPVVERCRFTVAQAVLLDSFAKKVNLTFGEVVNMIVEEKLGAMQQPTKDAQEAWWLARKVAGTRD